MKMKTLMLLALLVPCAVSAQGDNHTTESPPPTNETEATSLQTQSEAVQSDPPTTTNAGDESSSPTPAAAATSTEGTAPTETTAESSETTAATTTSGQSNGTTSTATSGTGAPSEEPSSAPAERTTDEPTSKTTAAHAGFDLSCQGKVCTYEMSLPGLDMDKYTEYKQLLDEDLTEAEMFASTIIPTLDSEVKKEIKYLNEEIDFLNETVANISSTVDEIKDFIVAITGYVDTVANNVYLATASWQKLNETMRNTCYYKQCSAKVTTPAPTTTTPTTTVTTTFPCHDGTNGTCQRGGKCSEKLYPLCECPGNLDGTEMNCASSICQWTNQQYQIGEFESPLSFANGSYDEEDPQCKWVIPVAEGKQLEVNSTVEVNLQPGAELKVTIGSSKLALTSRTNQKILNSFLKRANEKSPATFTLSVQGKPDRTYFYFKLNYPSKPPQQTSE